MSKLFYRLWDIVEFEIGVVLGNRDRISKNKWLFQKIAIFSSLQNIFEYLLQRPNLAKKGLFSRTKNYHNICALFYRAGLVASQKKTFFYKIFFKNMLFSRLYDSYISVLRVNKVYIKSRYPKVRLVCKNIVLLTLMINIILIFELSSVYYNTSINFSYIYAVSLFFYIHAAYVWIKYLTRVIV